MSDMNVVVIAGRLTADPERRTTPKGVPVVGIRIASNQYYQGEEHPVFVDVSAFGRTAEVVSEYFKKGDPILVRGSLRLDEWTTKDGDRRSKHKIVADQISFFSKNGRRSAGGANTDANTGTDGNGDAARPVTAAEEAEEIPF